MALPALYIINSANGSKLDLSTTLRNVFFPNPIFTASGCAAYGQELDQFFDITRIGAVVTKSIMMEPRSGRPTPRMAETPSGMLNSIGLQGPGIDRFLAVLGDRVRALAGVVELLVPFDRGDVLGAGPEPGTRSCCGMCFPGLRTPDSGLFLSCFLLTGNCLSLTFSCTAVCLGTLTTNR